MNVVSLMETERVAAFARRKVHRSRPGLMMARLASEMADDLCLVSDISPHGAGLRTIRSHAAGERVTLDFGDALAVAGTVRWSEDGRCGIAFDTIVDLEPLFRAGLFRSPAITGEPVAAAPDAAGRRTQPRLRRCASVELRTPGRCYRGQLVDVSPAGGRIDLDDAGSLTEGDRISFAVEDRFDCEGIVRWTGPGSIGVAFDPPLRLWKLEKWLVEGMDQCGACAADSCAAPSFKRALIRREQAAGGQDRPGRT